MKLILASSSSGRKSLFETLKIPFEVIESKFNEEKIQDLDPVRLALLRAEAKAKSVADQFSDEKSMVLVIGADTVGFLDDWIFGKPKSRKEAEEMLERLSGQTHRYVSAYSIIRTWIRESGRKNKGLNQNLAKMSGYDISSVTFRQLSKVDVKRYLDRVEYLKLAGSFKLANSPQDFVVKTEGSISNIIGISLEKIIPILKVHNLL